LSEDYLGAAATMLLFLLSSMGRKYIVLITVASKLAKPL